MKKLKILYFYLIQKLYMNFYIYGSRSKFEDWQRRKLLKHLKFVSKNSPFYSHLRNIETLAQFQQVSLSDKTLLMDNFNQINTRGIDRDEAFEVAIKAEKTRDFAPKIKQCTVGLSSGTSGHRGLFVVSEQEEIRWASSVIAKLLVKPIWKQQKIALFLRANSNLYESTNQGKIQFYYFDLLEPIENHVNKLNKMEHGVLVAPPSILRKLSEQRLNKTLHFKPDVIYSCAEVLDPLDEKIISQAFEMAVRQIYQATEGFLGYTCAEGTIHLNEDMLFIEKEFIIERDRRFIPIITDMNRKTQPFIRYRLNDILTLKDTPCRCGSVLIGIEQIEGRCDDLIHLISKNSEKIVTVVPDFIRRNVLMASNDIREYYILQKVAGKLEIQLEVLNKANQNKIEQDILINFNHFAEISNLQPISIHFTPYEKRELGLKKLRRVESLIK